MHYEGCHCSPAVLAAIPDLEQMTTLSPLRTKLVASALPMPIVAANERLPTLAVAWRNGRVVDTPLVLPVMTTLKG